MNHDSRSAILNRIRTALGDHEPREAAYARLVRNYQRAGDLTEEARVALMIERLHEYDATVVECSPSALPEAIAVEIAKSGHRLLAAPAALPREWLVEEVRWLVDNQLSSSEIEKADGIVTAAFCGIADSGTIVLHHSESEGRRIVTLLPDWHLCVLKTSQLVETFPEYVTRCNEPPRLATYFSGPSATADIEMTRIKGVHGPRFLTVVLVQD